MSDIQQPATIAQTEPRNGGSLQRCVRRRPSELYITEKVEAYNLAISCLETHEPADGDATGIARKMRQRLAKKLDRQIQKWVDALPPPNDDKLTDHR